MLELPVLVGMIAAILAKTIKVRERGKKLGVIGFFQALVLGIISIPCFLLGVRFLGIPPTLGVLGITAVFVGSLIMYGVGVLLTELIERGLKAI